MTKIIIPRPPASMFFFFNEEHTRGAASERFVSSVEFNMNATPSS